MIATRICICIVFAIFMFGNFYAISGETAPPTDANGIPVDPVMQKCNESHHTSIEVLTHLNTTGAFADEKDKVPMCFMNCYLQHSGVLDSDGKVQKPKALEMWGAENEGVIQHCADTKAEDPHPCVQTYNLVKCVMTGVLEKAKSG